MKTENCIKKLRIFLFNFFKENSKSPKALQQLIKEMEAEGILDSSEVEGKFQYWKSFERQKKKR